ncbi:MAG: hypothetical protein ABMB14_19120 [Myxococcota bacterium]
MWIHWLASARAATLTVGAGQTYATIGDALADAIDGDVIEVHAGTYREELVVDVPVSIIGVGDPVIEATATAEEVVDVLAAALIEGVTIDGRGLARGVHGGSGDLTLRGVTVRNGEAQDGGGLMFYGPRRLVVADCTFVDNHAWSEGGGVYAKEHGLVAVSDSTFERNTAGDGGAIFAEELRSLLIHDAVFDHNEASSFGGALALHLNMYATREDHELIGNRFCANLAFDGGAVEVVRRHPHHPGGVRVEGNRFQENVAERHGGAIDGYSHTSWGVPRPWTLFLVGNTFVANEAITEGGAHVALSQYARLQAYDDLFAYAVGDAGLFAEDVGGLDNDWFFDNDQRDFGGAITAGSFGPSTGFGSDPLLTNYSPDGDCTNDDTSPAPGSPLIDAGTPLLLDPDGSPSDIGTAW